MKRGTSRSWSLLNISVLAGLAIGCSSAMPSDPSAAAANLYIPLANEQPSRKPAHQKGYPLEPASSNRPLNLVTN